MRTWILAGAALIAFAIDPFVFQKLDGWMLPLTIGFIAGFLWDISEYFKKL